MRLPLIALDEVYHLGTLDPAHRGIQYDTSYEGSGLSISLCPDAWRSIAKLGGRDLHRLSRAGALYLDVLSIAPEDMREIEEWAISRGYGGRRLQWQLKEWNPDYEEWTWSNFGSLKDAEEELEYLREFEEEVEASIETHEPFLLTEEGAARAGGYRTSIEALDIAAMLYAEEMLPDSLPDLMGVWWAEQYAPEMLSAPRGAVFPERVRSFSIQRVHDLPDDEDLLEAVPDAVVHDIAQPALETSPSP